VEGKDFSALFDSPSQVLSEEAYAQYSRCPGERYWPTVYPLEDWGMNNCEGVPAPNITYMVSAVQLLSLFFGAHQLCAKYWITTKAHTHT
jgi:hypothetical protein